MKRDNYTIQYDNNDYHLVTWKLNSFVKLLDKKTHISDRFRLIAWLWLSNQEKEIIVHPWKSAEIQQMENEFGTVGTVAVMFETYKNNEDGFIVVYIDEKTLKVTGTETFY